MIITSWHISIPVGLGLESSSYWLNKKSNLILNRFSKKFVLEALEFILGNNFQFDEMFYNQSEGTETGTKCVALNACLVIGYKEKTRLFTIEFPNFFLNWRSSNF